MNVCRRSLPCALAVLVFLAPVGALAQSTPEAYGTAAETLLPVNAYDFEGLDSSSTTGWEPFVNRRFRTGGTIGLTAGLSLPSGVEVTSIEISGCDMDPLFDLEGYFLECPEPADGCTSVATVFSPSGTPGCGTFKTTLPAPRTVNNATTTYSFQVNLQSEGPSLTFRRMAVSYRRQVTVAPATATFSDVPVGHPFHRFVEALAAAGITGGCTPGQFCPGASVTRGQMAVFLAVALGLHFPN